MAETYRIGTKIQVWRESDVKTITFIVTEDCNLVCKYCYITGKNKIHKMSLETAKKAVDFILSHPEDFPENGVVWEFIGGEPTIEMDLIDQICDYIKLETYKRNHKWFNNFRFSFASNGLLYSTPAVQKYIKKNLNNLSITLSIDGNKIKHDMQRVKQDGTGSYDEVIQNVPLWLEQFPGASTKATFSSDDLPYVKDSVISLWNLGIKEVGSNVVFEDAWKEGDELILETQLKELADYIIANHLWDKYNCTFFGDNLGYPYTEENLKTNWCGAGKMLAIDHEGKFYPCVRFVGYSLNKRQGYVIGDIEHGYDYNKLRPFMALSTRYQSTEDCLHCQVATGCAWCQGFNYDEAVIPTIYQKATHICKMHKARVRANDYYWTRLKEVAGIRRQGGEPRKTNLYFILADDSAQFCVSAQGPTSGQRVSEHHQPRLAKMSLEIFNQGLDFARANFFTPVLLLPKIGLTQEQQELLKDCEAVYIHDSHLSLDQGENIVSYTSTQIALLANQLPEEELQQKFPDAAISLLKVTREEITNLASMTKTLLKKYRRVNIILEDVESLTESDLKDYEHQLEELSNYLYETIVNGNEVEVNVISDRIYLEKMANCNAGLENFALAPDGNFYLCPAFYFDQSEEPVGSVTAGINFNYREFLTLEKSPTCANCDAYHCRRCVYQNKKATNEYLIPGERQCLTSHIERDVSKKLVEELLKQGYLTKKYNLHQRFPEIDYADPLEKVYIPTYSKNVD